MPPWPEDLGPPWSRSLAGRWELGALDSPALAGNPLGDPARRPHLNAHRPPPALPLSRAPHLRVP